MYGEGGARVRIFTFNKYSPKMSGDKMLQLKKDHICDWKKIKNVNVY